MHAECRATSCRRLQQYALQATNRHTNKQMDSAVAYKFLLWGGRLKRSNSQF